MYDSNETLFYIDPPYVDSTRVDGKYKFEFSNDDHEELLDIINNISGYAVISGYDCDLYSRRLDKWHRYEMTDRSARNSTRTEVIWLSPNCPKGVAQSSLF